MSTKKRKSIVSKKSSIKRAKKDYSFNLAPTVEEIDFLSILLDRDLNIKEGTLIHATFDFTLVETLDGIYPEDTKRIIFHKFNRNTILLFLGLIYDENNSCIAAKVVNNERVCIVPFATFEETKAETATQPEDFVDFFSCIFSRWDKQNI
jgi:hypothetical protein